MKLNTSNSGLFLTPRGEEKMDIYIYILQEESESIALRWMLLYLFNNSLVNGKTLLTSPTIHAGWYIRTTLSHRMHGCLHIRTTCVISSTTKLFLRILLLVLVHHHKHLWVFSLWIGVYFKQVPTITIKGFKNTNCNSTRSLFCSFILYCTSISRAFKIILLCIQLCFQQSCNLKSVGWCMNVRSWWELGVGQAWFDWEPVTGGSHHQHLPTEPCDCENGKSRENGDSIEQVDASFTFLKLLPTQSTDEGTSLSI